MKICTHLIAQQHCHCHYNFPFPFRLISFFSGFSFPKKKKINFLSFCLCVTLSVQGVKLSFTKQNHWELTTHSSMKNSIRFQFCQKDKPIDKFSSFFRVLYMKIVRMCQKVYLYATKQNWFEWKYGKKKYVPVCLKWYNIDGFVFEAYINFMDNRAQNCMIYNYVVTI